MKLEEPALCLAVIATTDGIRERTYRKVTRRLIPFLFLCYVLSMLDRINIGFAQLQMKHDLALGDATYGLAAGAFFIGYLLFEIPSNVILQKIGARKTISRIMLCWGFASAAMMFVRTPVEFVCLRFLLGAFEAGFMPGVFLYLTYWYPPRRQGRVIGAYMTAAVVAGLIAGPLSTNIMTRLASVLGLHGWQWLFVCEGIPSVAVGILAFFYLTDRPADASWLTDEEKALVEGDIALISSTWDRPVEAGWYDVFRQPKVLILGFCSFAAQAGSYVIFFWMPQIMKSTSHAGVSLIGLYSMLPYAAAIVTMTFWAAHSDRKMERRWHFALAVLTSTAGFLMVIANPGSLILTTLALTVAAAAVMAAFPVFWAVVAVALPPTSLAAGLALISSLGSLGGAFSPALIGFVRESTGRIDAGLYIVMALMVIGSLAMLAVIPRQIVRRE
ncbi:major Facilitator Superfamily protein [Paraburkholderia xenovorans LB400]|uniref:Major facilitator superfamily (MFS) anion(Metabolite)/cation symporter n=1 Tax=Paraburkholderia xenovorans (strain LB400) TaxID=266265 RepID=Q13G64_PARXL|nr:MFS transporter [Paraburkholderia xenovorans]ABE36925.1 major facilitator superfamily (MFS) anion(metabolite)/cation symporter [Paraburkholderia xenovorans LB400]AIP34239.1 major Facilitator Superfamily protein [Paraburkholderia xenovorans LB400]